MPVPGCALTTTVVSRSYLKPYQVYTTTDLTNKLVHYRTIPSELAAAVEAALNSGVWVWRELAIVAYSLLIFSRRFTRPGRSALSTRKCKDLASG